MLSKWPKYYTHPKCGDTEVYGDNSFVLSWLHYLYPVTGYSSLLYRWCELMHGCFCLDSQPLCKVYMAWARQNKRHSSIMQGWEWHCERNIIFQCKLTGTEAGIVPRSHKHQPSFVSLKTKYILSDVFWGRIRSKSSSWTERQAPVQMLCCYLLAAYSTAQKTWGNKAKTTPPSPDFPEHNFFSLKIQDFNLNLWQIIRKL